MYRKNLFGDITAIYKGATKVAEYVYDAWGNCTITLNTNGYGTRNPFRYRGYYFDSETGFYYLNSRYYSPEWRRFISPDDTTHLNPKSVSGFNLYYFRGDNPVKLHNYYLNDSKSSIYYRCIDPVKILASDDHLDKQVALLSVALVSAALFISRNSSLTTYVTRKILKIYVSYVFSSLMQFFKNITENISPDDANNLTDWLTGAKKTASGWGGNPGAAGAPKIYKKDELFPDDFSVEWE